MLQPDKPTAQKKRHDMSHPASRPADYARATRSAAIALTILATTLVPPTLANPGELLAATPSAWSPDGAADKDHFGASLDVRGELLAVGATGVDGPGDGAGAVYLYENSTSGWQETTALQLEDVGADARFGSAVSLADGWLAAGASGVYAGQGAIYLFNRQNDEWQQRQRLLLPESQDFTFFGSTLDMEGDRLIAGAPGFDAGATDSGIVMTYTRGEGGKWAAAGRLQPETPVAGERFGTAVVLEGGRALVGAAASDGEGAAYLFEYQEGGWAQVARLSESVGDGGGFGTSVALRGNTALVGAPFAQNDSREPQGAAFVYTEQAGNWERRATLHSDAPNPRDEFGAAVALAEDMALVSSPRDDLAADDAGAVVLFTRQGQDWSQAGRLPGAEPAAYDELGRSLAVDAAAGAVLVGTPNDAAPGTTGKYPGTVTAYRR